jgi:hypothetical protein
MYVTDLTEEQDYLNPSLNCCPQIGFLHEARTLNLATKSQHYLISHHYASHDPQQKLTSELIIFLLPPRFPLLYPLLQPHILSTRQ